MTTFLRNLWEDQSGASAAEYALILAIVGSGIAIATIGLGKTISNSMDKASKCITDADYQTAGCK